MANAKYAQPNIDRKLREVNPKLLHRNTDQAVTSIADEIGEVKGTRNYNKRRILADEKQANREGLEED
jgi:hypothetical protein